MLPTIIDPTREINYQWRHPTPDPHLMAALDALVAIENKIIAPMLENNEVPGFNRLSSFAFSELPEGITLGEGELVILHYPVSVTFDVPPEEGTATYEGMLHVDDYEIMVRAVTGVRVEGMDAISSRSANIPELLREVYEANEYLWDTEGLMMLQHPIRFIDKAPYEPFRIGGQSYINWAFTISIWLEKQRRNARWG
jgi:hypothetical protein